MSESIGNTLKEARAKKSVSLEEVHSKTKIHPRVLQLLEENKFEKLPSPLFVKSFIKSYAEFLEINAEELVNVYEKEGKAEPEQVLFIKSPQLRGKKNQIDKNWVVLPAVLAVVIGIVTALVFLFHFIGDRFSDSTSSVSTNPKQIASPLKKEKSKSKKTETAKKPNEWLRSVDMGNFPTLGKKIPLELNIKAVDNVWLRITSDGKVLFQSILRRGQSERWTANSSVEIWTGNSSNMVLTLNGHLLGSPGKGVVKKMIINHEGVRIPS